ncbi:MAG: NAD(P)-dependent oxidoreductase [Eubacteriales bacterium]|nr:NAD(P)-dependent oxidoreductase [Eubacteriales bacterium]MDD3882243.1 NAD(P)-dependent oxidoreductase [Eubacteriales bacterium]MDD4512592.1 NAD(P)-dependent oxidoreductase [Eubacteriales bacterium]
MRCILLGGDERQGELAVILRRAGFHSVQLCHKALTPIDLPALTDELSQLGSGDLLILPQPISEKYGRLCLSGISEGISLEKALECVNENVTVCAFRCETKIKRKRLVLPMESEEYLAYTSQLTAKALLLHWYHDEEFTLLGKKVLITGYGRCAKAIARELKDLGVKVIVSARSVHQLSDAYMCGFGAVPLETLYEKSADFDILVNTIPFQVLPAAYIGSLSKSVRLYDIASSPYGFSIETVESLNLYAERLPGLPGRYYPRLCAQKVYELIVRNMREAEI